MRYRNIGKSGIKVSEIGLGSWLTYGTTIDKNDSIRIIHEAVELGINFFDTANFYGYGEAEKILGKALQETPRHSLVIASKVYFPMSEEINHRGLSRKHIIEQCDETLKRLNLEYLDLYQCHRFDQNVPIEETARAMDDLIKQGKVLYWGVSKWNVVQMMNLKRICDMHLLHRFISNQPRYNLLDREIEKSILPYCEKEGIGQLVYSPLAQGTLTGKYKYNQPAPEKSRAKNTVTSQWMNKFLTKENLQIVERLLPIALEEGLTLSQLSLAWILRERNISSCIVGATNIEQLKENVNASGKQLSNEALLKIQKVLQGVFI